MFRNRRGITGLALAALWSIAVPVAIAQTPASPIVIKFSNVNTANSPKNLAADYFKKLAEERTKGRVKIEIYPNSVLYKDKEELEALQLGSVQMLAPTLGKFGPLGLKEFEVFDLPYLFENYEQVHKVTEGPIGQKLLRSMGSKKILGLAFWDNGFKQMNANRPLRMPDDFRGLKVRIFSSKVLDAQFRAVGAIPQVLAASEMYQAMQTGLVDGNENTESTFYQFKLFEVQKYLTLSNHGYVGYAVVVNKEFWEGLPADIREILEQAMKRSDGLQQPDHREGEPRGARGDPEDRQDRGHHADARAEGRMEEGDGQVARRHRGARRQGVARGDLQGNGHRPEKAVAQARRFATRPPMIAPATTSASATAIGQPKRDGSSRPRRIVDTSGVR